jgi:hypothetical protein
LHASCFPVVVQFESRKPSFGLIPGGTGARLRYAKTNSPRFE